MSPMKKERSAGNVMVVDDNPANLKLMGDMLGSHGYNVRLFPRGRMALASASQHQPDLVLLDINMPEMDGYEVCRRLKADDVLSHIPVIFLSALQETQDKVRGLQCGGVDYISKPFQIEEIQARVETHLKIHELQRALKRQNERLEELVADRTRELREAHARLKLVDRAKNDFLNLISHEFRTPLNGILGVGELALDCLPHTQESRDLLDMFDVSRRRILSIMDDALLLTQIDVAGEKFCSGSVCLSRVLRRILDMSADSARQAAVSLEIADEFKPCSVVGEEDLLVTALHALLEAGVKLTKPGRSVILRQEIQAGMIRISIESDGESFPEKAIEDFFELFSLNEATVGGVHLGLRPAVASRILKLFGGTASISNRSSSGICLIGLLILANS